MAEPTTIARPYAEAAFAIARDAGALSAWSEMLRYTARIIADPQVAAALDNPKLGAPEKESLLLSLVSDKLSHDARNFLRVLIEADRITMLPWIVTMFDALKDEAEDTAKATIETAFPMSDSELDEMKAALERRFGKKIEATVQVNKSLIGGARVTVGDSVIDGSVQAKLQSMANQLRA